MVYLGLGGGGAVPKGRGQAVNNSNSFFILDQERYLECKYQLGIPVVEGVTLE